MRGTYPEYLRTKLSPGSRGDKREIPPGFLIEILGEVFHRTFDTCLEFLDRRSDILLSGRAIDTGTVTEGTGTRE